MPPGMKQHEATPNTHTAQACWNHSPEVVDHAQGVQEKVDDQINLRRTVPRSPSSSDPLRSGWSSISSAERVTDISHELRSGGLHIAPQGFKPGIHTHESGNVICARSGADSFRSSVVCQFERSVGSAERKSEEVLRVECTRKSESGAELIEVK